LDKRKGNRERLQREGFKRIRKKRRTGIAEGWLVKECFRRLWVERAGDVIYNGNGTNSYKRKSAGVG